MFEMTEERIRNYTKMLVDGKQAVLSRTAPMTDISRIEGAVFSASAAHSIGLYREIAPSEFDKVNLTYLLVRTNRGNDGEVEWVTPLGVFAHKIYAILLVRQLSMRPGEYEIIRIDGQTDEEGRSDGYDILADEAHDESNPAQSDK